MGLILANLWGWAVLHRRIVFTVVGLIALLFFVWWGITKCGQVRTQRNIDKLKTNINAATQELANAKANLANDKIDEAVKTEKLQEATNEYANAVSATEAQKAVTNQALANIAAAKDANTANTSAEDLKKLLDDLDKQQ